jgi:hypothetical protein
VLPVETTAPKMRKTLVLGAAAATIVAASAAGIGVSYAATGRNATCNVPSQYPTIQAAVDAANCGTVKVAPGAYAGTVTISRSVTLNGARAGQDARTRRAGGESVISATGPQTPAIAVTADNVTIDGFTLNGPADANSAALVMQNHNSSETVQNTVFNNPGRAASITTSRTTFRSNVVKNAPTATDGFQTNSGAVHDVAFTGNTFTGPPAASYNADVTVINGDKNITVTGNKSTGDGTLAALFFTTGARVTGNTVTGANGSSAVYVGGANRDVTVADNTISGAGSAVKVANDFGDGKNSAVGITRNTLRNNKYGVNVAAGSATGTVTATRNTITGNSVYGVLNDPGSGGSVTATCNWWGALTGPAVNGRGRGDQVSSGVTYKPWLILPNLALPCR